jgi:hypothetical protein
MIKNWNSIFTTTDPILASIIIAMLHENEIQAVELNKRDSTYQAFGTIEVYCPPDQTIHALHLINQLQHGESIHEK